MSEKSDVVMGTAVASNKGWQERCRELCDPDLWEVTVRPKPELFSKLTGTELTRLQPKIEMVKVAAQYMLAAMIKGTVKYPTDNLDVAQWQSSLLGETADLLNYVLLMLGAAGALQKQGS